MFPDSRWLSSNFIQLRGDLSPQTSSRLIDEAAGGQRRLVRKRKLANPRSPSQGVPTPSITTTAGVFARPLASCRICSSLRSPLRTIELPVIAVGSSAATCCLARPAARGQDGAVKSRNDVTPAPRPQHVTIRVPVQSCKSSLFIAKSAQNRPITLAGISAKPCWGGRRFGKRSSARYDAPVSPGGWQRRHTARVLAEHHKPMGGEQSDDEHQHVPQEKAQ